MYLHSKTKCDDVNYLFITIDNYIYMFVLVHLYLLYVQRLKLTYKNTNQRLSMSTYKLLKGLYCFMFGIIWIRIIADIFGEYLGYVSIINVALTIIFFMIYLISSVFLLVTYTTKSVNLVITAGIFKPETKILLLLETLLNILIVP